MIESIQTQVSQRYHILQGVVMLMLSGTWRCMPVNPPPANSKVETMFKLCKEENITLKPIALMIDISFHIDIGRYVHWNESYTMFISQIQCAAG